MFFSSLLLTYSHNQQWQQQRLDKCQLVFSQMGSTCSKQGLLLHSAGGRTGVETTDSSFRVQSSYQDTRREQCEEYQVPKPCSKSWKNRQTAWAVTANKTQPHWHAWEQLCLLAQTSLKHTAWWRCTARAASAQPAQNPATTAADSSFTTGSIGQEVLPEPPSVPACNS